MHCCTCFRSLVVPLLICIQALSAGLRCGRGRVQPGRAGAPTGLVELAPLAPAQGPSSCETAVRLCCTTGRGNPASSMCICRRGRCTGVVLNKEGRRGGQRLLAVSVPAWEGGRVFQVCQFCQCGGLGSRASSGDPNVSSGPACKAEHRCWSCQPGARLLGGQGTQGRLKPVCKSHCLAACALVVFWQVVNNHLVLHCQ